MVSMRLSFIGYPNPVNEVVARVTAAGVVVIAALAIGLQARWLAIVLAVGFLLRVVSGPRFSPLALLASKVVVPRLPVKPRPVPGPPKRFAQGVGLVFSAAAIVLFYGFDLRLAGFIVLGVLLLAAFLESAVGLCLGCQAFALLIKLGVIPEEVCESCANIWTRIPAPSATPAASQQPSGGSTAA